MKWRVVSIALSLGLLLLAACSPSRRASSASKTVPSEKVTRNSPDRVVASDIVKEARKWLGTPYKYGGQTRRGTDCSGMIMVIFRDVAGVKLPRDSRSMQAYCRRIGRSDLCPGDLVFFATKAGGSRVGHVGLYIGDNKIIHASGSKGVITSDLDEKYYTRHFHSAGRVDAISYAATGRKLPGKKDKKEPEKELPPTVTYDEVVAATVEEVILAELDSALMRLESAPEVDTVTADVDTVPYCVDETSVLPADTIVPSVDVPLPGDTVTNRADSIRAEVGNAFKFAD